MEHKGHPTNENQLFHGTSQDTAVRAIFKENFDWRVCGKNATMLGKGSYFAKDASFSDRYTAAANGPVPGLRWMFMARVLTGVYCKGNPAYVKPPPLDAGKPDADRYDSCVDHEHRPNIFVVFDSDQCYPEYVISYN